jgi:putative hydrolase of the HAD superfamily
MKYIESWLSKLEPMEPKPTGVAPRLSKLHGVKALIFDIYGTLLISASGDIDQSTILSDSLKMALKESGYNLLKKGAKQDERIFTDLLIKFVDLIKSHQEQSRLKGNPFPEIDIRKVWEDLLEHAEDEKIIRITQNADPVKLTFVFELLSNRVWPMPQMHEVIKHFHDKGCPLGIVSNAQFYTPVMMNYFLSGNVRITETIEYFNPALTVFSYRLLKAKPDTTIFDPVLDVLKNEFDICPEESVFIGNDMYKDVFPAHQSGMKTIFFAGDQRSLRLREDQEAVQGLRPDAVITHLDQLKQIIEL